MPPPSHERPILSLPLSFYLQVLATVSTFWTATPLDCFRSPHLQALNTMLNTKTPATTATMLISNGQYPFSFYLCSFSLGITSTRSHSFSAAATQDAKNISKICATHGSGSTSLYRQSLELSWVRRDGSVQGLFCRTPRLITSNSFSPFG